MSSDGDSVFDILGLDRDAVTPDPPAEVWAAALAHAVDPDSLPVDDAIVPIMDDSDIDGGDESLLLVDEELDDLDLGSHREHDLTQHDTDGEHPHDHDGHNGQDGHWSHDDIDLGGGSDLGI